MFSHSAENVPEDAALTARLASEMSDREMPVASHATTQATQDATKRPILFYDGVCGLCNRAVDFVLVRAASDLFLFAPLQGETARERLSAEDTKTIDSIVLLEGRLSYRRSAAVVRVLWRLGGVWKLLAGLLWLIPSPLRDVGYKLVARTRYRLFGKKETCRLPTADERSRFLP